MTDLVLETRILGLDFRNEDLRILGFKGFLFRKKDFFFKVPLGTIHTNDGF
jgi:hypothetical protein